jgi:WhiB family transcriptional regulator, redox-sensing transcriptional regulator
MSAITGLEGLWGANPTWMDSASCAGTDPELFFPPTGGSNRPAMKVCATCPVREECLEYCIEIEGSMGRVERFGIWGGTSAHQRARSLPKPARIHRRAPCGTEAAERAHNRAGEPSCGVCRAAGATRRQIEREYGRAVVARPLRVVQ